MEPMTTHKGIVAPLDRSDVDTDQLMPKQFLKRVERSGFGKFLFFDWRYKQDGSEDATFVLNRPEYKGATILLARRNFGCGSSREHAPWGIADFGFRVLIAASFADIFYNNCFKNGILPITLPERDLDTLFATASPLTLTVDLQKKTITGKGISLTFDLDSHRQTMLLEGRDDIDETLDHLDEIGAYESVYGLR